MDIFECRDLRSLGWFFGAVAVSGDLGDGGPVLSDSALSDSTLASSMIESSRSFDGCRYPRSCVGVGG
jgi:hypothetical protein